MNSQAAAWHAEHERFRRLLDFLQQQIDVFHGGGHPDYERMRDSVYYLCHFANEAHHPAEDVAFALLAKRDPSLELAINRLIQEHRVLAVAGETLLKYLEDILVDVIIERAKVEAAADSYLVYYRYHLAAEESEVMPRAAELFGPDDWAAVAAAVPLIPDPLFGDEVHARYRDLRGEIDRRAAP